MDYAIYKTIDGKFPHAADAFHFERIRFYIDKL